MQNKNEPRNLIGDLESIRRLLREEAESGQITTPEKIPILLEAVTPAIPTLQETVDTSTTDESVSASTDISRPVTSTTEAQLTLEGEQLIENLLEEYLPLMELRLREQLRLRLNFIIKEQMRKYR